MVFGMEVSAMEKADPNRLERDVFKTDAGELKITFIGHATLMFECGGKVIHIDPWTKAADYSKLPKADAILITHNHYDHLDVKAVNAIRKEGTQIIIAGDCLEKIPDGVVMKNDEKRKVLGFEVDAVPAYNIVNQRPDGGPYHPKGEGNGYIITFGKTRVYAAGDTENTPEMKALKNIDIAFLPMNLPYTMTPEMVADAARTFSPKILYPYHYGKTDTKTLVELMKGAKDIEVRIRKME
ncbi:MAG: MBL fold metallo-hydrolase [Planctomycetes bacterium]|nr:MBL fold metallo-hydrolase [Planctomycetota bacterium]